MNTINRRRLEQLAAKYEEYAQAIRVTLQLLDEGPTKSTHSNVIADALALEAERSQRQQKKRGRPPKTRKATEHPDYHRRAYVVNRRERTKEFLDSFDHTIPTFGDPQLAKELFKGHPPIGTLTGHGYLKSKGEGYIRTDKEFTVSQNGVNA